MPKTPPAQPPAHVTVGEAAEMLGFSPSTIQKLADAGSVEVLRTPGGHRRIDRSSLERYRLHAGEPAERAAALPAPSILLVDDDELALAWLQTLVGTHFPQCAVTTARDGLEAVLHIAQHKPQLVLTDLGMPHDGFRLVQLLRGRAELRDIRVAVISGLTPAQIAQEGGLPPDVAFFPKPLQQERLLGYLDAFIQLYQAGHAGTPSP